MEWVLDESTGKYSSTGRDNSEYSIASSGRGWSLVVSNTCVIYKFMSLPQAKLAAETIDREKAKIIKRNQEIDRR